MKRKIVLLDDDVDFLKETGAVLEEGGYEVLACEKPTQNISLIQKFQPDCLLLDVRMPLWDGKTFLPWIQRQIPDLAVVVCTGMTAFDRSFFFRSGVRYIIQKPFTAEQLFKTIDRAIAEQPPTFVKPQKAA